MQVQRWGAILSIVLVTTAAWTADRGVRKGAVLYVAEDDVKLAEDPEQVFSDNFDITLHTGSRVRVINVAEDRALVTVVDLQATVPRWIPRSVLQEAKPLEKKEKMPDGLGDMAERKTILGTWRIISYESQGVEYTTAPAKRAGYTYWRFAENEAVTWLSSDRMAIRYRGFHIDPSATLKRLDILNSDGKNTIYQTGIYKFEGDKLIWVRDTTARKGENEPRKRILRTFRPTGYRTRPGDGRERMVLERVPDDNKEAVPPDGSK